MEFTHLFVILALIFLTLIVRNHGSKSGEEYWKSVWPNTPMPKALSDLLISESGTGLPIKGREEKQYRTVFFEHDLYPGKRMSLGVHKHSDIHLTRSKAELLVEKASQPFGINIWWDGKTSEKENQPFGFILWHDNTLIKVENAKPRKLFEAHKLDIEKERHIIHDYCGRPSAIGEEKHCATSLESMLDFAISKLGKNIKVMSSSFAQNQDQYVVEEVKKLGDKAVMCHRLNFKKVVFYCHQVNATTTYMVPLVSFDGTKSKALTICHHDTRGMDPNMLYHVLKVRPGTIPVCHFIGNKAVAWVPNDDVSESNGHPCVI
ncbi:hypothetical protein P8452_74739 [Trifolium repens]|nr:hypothetical protein P8452_74739 [Trifolium repens]